MRNQYIFFIYYLIVSECMIIFENAFLIVQLLCSTGNIKIKLIFFCNFIYHILFCLTAAESLETYHNLIQRFNVFMTHIEEN